jgi:nucleotide-binding universal stress UspA family protein
METILVGVDGSECAKAALTFAAREAALRGGSLCIVCAWVTSIWVNVGVFAPGPYVTEGYREHAEAVVQEAVARAGELAPSVPCEGKALEGQPGDVLLQAAHDATLLVVGCRGREGFASLLLGSVSQQVVHHVPCPVTVVRAAVC